MQPETFLEVKGALNMCPREGAPVSVFLALGQGTHHTVLGLHTSWKESFKCPEFKFWKNAPGGKNDNFTVSSYVFN